MLCNKNVKEYKRINSTDAGMLTHTYSFFDSPNR